MIKNHKWQEATSWLFTKRGIELNPKQPEINPDQRLEQELDPGQPHANPTPQPLDHASSAPNRRSKIHLCCYLVKMAI